MWKEHGRDRAEGRGICSIQESRTEPQNGTFCPESRATDRVIHFFTGRPGSPGVPIRERTLRERHRTLPGRGTNDWRRQLPEARLLTNLKLGRKVFLKSRKLPTEQKDPKSVNSGADGKPFLFWKYMNRIIIFTHTDYWKVYGKLFS